MNQKYDENLDSSTLKKHLAFPRDVETVISPQKAVVSINNSLKKIKDYRNDRLKVIEKVIAPLVPENIRDFLEKIPLKKNSIAYKSLVNIAGNFLSILIYLGFDKYIGNIKENQRLIILPYIDLKLRDEIRKLEQKKPFGWKTLRDFYQKKINVLAPVVDNLMNLISLAWTFCPGIGEPEKTTGFYNRFVFTSNGGFIDLGHFFNCAIVSYLYGIEEATRRGEAVEVGQRWLREKEWLTKIRERRSIQIISNLLWGYATSADTIEDRASDKFGIILGKYMREHHNNGKVIDYFVEMFPKLVQDSIKGTPKKSKFSHFFEVISKFFLNTFYNLNNGAVFNIKKYMSRFFDEYDAIDLEDFDTVPCGIFKSVLDFYTEKYNSDEWDSYTCKEWQVVIPQDLWEKVVRNREKFKEKLLPIKIQLKDSGRFVEPYSGNPPD